MGKVLQRAGGGLTAADRGKLIPSNIREGVVLFEGTSKQVTGTYSGPTRKILVGSWTPGNADSYGSGLNVRSRSFDVKSKLPDIYSRLTAKDFAVESNGVSWGRAHNECYGRCALSWPTISSYDPNTGVVTVANTTTIYYITNATAVGYISCYGINVYALLD